MKKRRGFTPLETKISKEVSKRFLRGCRLIELLVVISIIALLMSILMPALGKAKKTAQAAMCMANLHQWGLLWKFYTDDHKGFLPDRDGMNDWPMTIWEYHWKSEAPKTLREMLLCPAAKKTWEEGGRNPYMAWYNQEDQEEWEEDFGVYWPVIGSYVINLWASESDDGDISMTDGQGRTCSYLRTPNVKGASYGPIMLCAQWKDMEPYPADDPPQYEWSDWTSGPANEIRRPCIKRHGDYVNAVFLDFSVRRVGLKELWELWWYREWRIHLMEDGRPDFCTITADYSGWMCHMKDYATN